MMDGSKPESESKSRQRPGVFWVGEVVAEKLVYKSSKIFVRG